MPSPAKVETWWYSIQRSASTSPWTQTSMALISTPRRRFAGEERPGGRGAVPLHGPHGGGRENSSRAERVKLEAQRTTGIAGAQEHHVRRDDPPAGRVPDGGDDGLPEHLAAFDDGPTFVRTCDAREAEMVVAAQV